MDSIDEALKERAAQLEEEQAKVQAEHRERMDELKAREDKARLKRAEEQKLLIEAAEKKERDKKEFLAAQRRQELEITAKAETENNLRIKALEEAAVQTEKLAKRKADLEHMEELARKAAADAEAALAPKIDTETIMPNPLVRFLQKTPD